MRSRVRDAHKARQWRLITQTRAPGHCRATQPTALLYLGGGKSSKGGCLIAELPGYIHAQKESVRELGREISDRL